MSFLYKRERSPFWYYGWRDEAGEAHGKSLKTTDKIIAEVKRAEEDRRRAYSEIGLADPKARWSVFVKDYLEWANGKKRPKGVEKDILIINVYHAAMNPVFMKDLTVHSLDKFLSSIQAKTSKSNASVYYRHLKAILRKAVKWKFLSRSPFDDIEVIRPDKKEKRFLYGDEIPRLRKSAKEDRKDASLMVEILLNTGIRSDELCTLRKEKIYHDRNLIGVTGKGGRERLVPYPEALESKLRPFKGQEGYLFGQNGKPLSRFTLYGVIQRLYDRAGIKNAHTHTMRHTNGTHLAMSGVDQKAIQSILGHASMQTTEGYIHTAQEHLKKAAQKLRFR